MTKKVTMEVKSVEELKELLEELVEDGFVPEEIIDKLHKMDQMEKQKEENGSSPAPFWLS